MLSMSKARPTTDALQRIMGSFAEFEKKLDKLQDDVCYHGQTLNELRILVSNLSAGTIANPDEKPDNAQHCFKKTTAIQYDHFDEPLIKTKRKNAIQPFPKLRTRSFQNQGNRFTIPYSKINNPVPKVNTVKHMNKTLRPSKVDASRKASTMRSGKILEKRLSKI